MSTENFKVSVKKVTDKELMLSACESTFMGKSNQSLLKMYKSEHSPARTQMFWIQCKNIPLFVSTHLLRHHVGSQPFALTHRDDIKYGAGDKLALMVDKCLSLLAGGGSEIEIEEVVDTLKAIPEGCGRNTPTNLSLFINAQSLIDMAKSRLCHKAHKETMAVFKAIKEGVAEEDRDLAGLMVKKCVYRNGICGETKPCGFLETDKFVEELLDYAYNFNETQMSSWIRFGKK